MFNPAQIVSIYRPDTGCVRYWPDVRYNLLPLNTAMHALYTGCADYSFHKSAFDLRGVEYPILLTKNA